MTDETQAPTGPREALERQRARSRAAVAALLDVPAGPDVPAGLRDDRLLGCLLGLLAGDALGCPVEGLDAAEIARRYGRVTGLFEPRDRRRWRLPGLHSDDTQQALAVVEALRLAGWRAGAGPGAVPAVAEQLAWIYVRGLRSVPDASFGCWRGTGRNFRAAVSALVRSAPAGQGSGVGGGLLAGPWTGRARPTWPFGHGERSAGLGAAMRIPPVGLLADGVTELGALVAAITLLTHTDPLGTTSAYAIAAACRLLRARQPSQFAPADFLAELASAVREVEQRLPAVPGVGYTARDDGSARLVSELVGVARVQVEAGPDAALSAIARVTAAATGRPSSPTAGFGPPGVAASLYFFAHDADDPERALLAAVNAGGDTDTVGAIVGALCGTLHGPPAYRRLLPDLVAADLAIESVAAYRRGGGAGGPDLVVEEARLTGLQAAVRVSRAQPAGNAPAPAIEPLHGAVNAGDAPLHGGADRQSDAGHSSGGLTMQHGDGGTWVPDPIRAPAGRPEGGTAGPAPGGPALAGARFDPQDLTTVDGVSRLDGWRVPADVVRHTRSRAFRVRQYYQVDDVARFRAWRDLLGAAGGHERWVFYGLPFALAEHVFAARALQPYDASFPRAFGERALYLFERASDAAQAALRLGAEREGFLLSCRLVPGTAFQTRTGNPRATEPPPGYDSILVPDGTDLGFGALRGDMFVTYAPERLLIRFVTHIARP